MQTDPNSGVPNTLRFRKLTLVNILRRKLYRASVHAKYSVGTLFSDLHDAYIMFKYFRTTHKVKKSPGSPQTPYSSKVLS